jgi:hypothetical protein
MANSRVAFKSPTVEGFVFVTWGIVVAVNFGEAWQALRALAALRNLGYRDVALLLFDLRDVISSLIATPVASALLYLGRWYLLKRLERVKQNPAADHLGILSA